MQDTPLVYAIKVKIVTEPTIICPSCKTEIKLTESLAALLVEATRRDYDQRVAHKDINIAKRESLLRESGEARTESTESSDHQVARKLMGRKFEPNSGIAGKMNE